MIRTIRSTVLAGALLLMSTMSTAQQPGMGMGMGMAPAAPTIPPEGTRVLRDITYVPGGHGRFTDPKVSELIEMTLERYLK